MRLRSRSLATPSAAAFAVAIAVACGGSDKRIQVTYYFQAGSEATERQRPALQKLEAEFPQQVAVRFVDASSPDATRDLRRLDFPTHGLVVRNHRGIMLFKQSGDDFDIEEVRTILRQGIGSS